MISAVKRAGEAKLGIPVRQSVPFGWGGSTETGAGKAEKLKVPLVLMLSKRDSPARSTDAGAQNVGGSQGRMERESRTPRKWKRRRDSRREWGKEDTKTA